MADRIKGITVEIGGDTTGLSKALAGVNKEIRDTQSQLKDVNKLLKLDPTNSTLIEQKFKLLGQSVDETKKKLNDLKSVQDQMDAGLKNGSVTQQQYDAWQREIVATEQELKNLEKECKTTDSGIAATLKQAGSKMQEVGGKISDAGEGITKGVTVPIVAIGTASLAAFKEVDDGLDTVEQKTGASGAALDEMNQMVKDLATEIPTDFATAGAAVGEVNTRFKLSGDALDQLSGKFIKFSQINNTDVSTSVDNVSGVLNAFGQDSSNAGDLLDALNAAGQATGIDMGTLASSLQLNAVQLKEMGLNSQQAAGFMGMVEMSGLDTSAAMMGLKTAMKNATKDGQTLDQAIAKFSETMKGNGSETEKLQAAYDLFGSKAGAAIYNAASTGKLNLENLSGSLGNFSGSVENTFNQTLDPIDQFQMSMNSLKETGADIGNSLATVLAPVLKDISGALKTFSEIWNSIPEPVQNTIIKIALLAATIGPLLVAGGKIISAVGTITSAIGSLTTFLGIGTAATTAAGTAATATGAAVGAASIPLLPIIGIIAAIIAAVVAIIAIVKNWGAITDWFKGVWSGFCDGIQTAWIAVGDFFTQTLPNFFSDVGQKWSDGWNTMKTNAGTIWDNIKTGVGNSIDNIKTNVGNGLDNVKQSFSDKLSAAHDAASSIMENIRGAFSDKMSAARDGVSNAIDAIKGFFNFDWHLPEIKLPHFSIEGSFSLDPPSIPHIGVSWYKKAMGDGMVLNSPTIFGAQGGQLLAGGEAGPEAVVGVSSLSSMIQNAVAAQTGSITAAIVSAIAGASNTGDITIPVYIGNEQIDTIVVKASQRVNYRSGGR